VRLKTYAVPFFFTLTVCHLAVIVVKTAKRGFLLHFAVLVKKETVEKFFKFPLVTSE
jgi:hypothetical protein